MLRQFFCTEKAIGGGGGGGLFGLYSSASVGRRKTCLGYAQMLLKTEILHTFRISVMHI